MTWKFQSAVASFEDARSDWDALNQAKGNHIALDSGFVGSLLRHFGNERITLARNNGSANPGIALLVRQGAGRWETFQPSQAPLGLILLGRRDDSGDALLELARALPGYVLQLSVLQQDQDFSSFPAHSNGGRLQNLNYVETARITLNGTFEDYWKARGTNLRHNLSRRRRRMTEKGYSLELTEIRAHGDVDKALREYGHLESKGWKAGEGTAVSEDNVQGRFYREVFEYFCTRGEGIIYQLRLNGRVAASDLCLVRDGMMVVLKTAYDEELNEFSPAMLMREEILRKAYGSGQVRVIEFYGRVMEWHTKWSQEIRTIYHVNLFRHPWVAPLKKFVGRFR